MYEALYKIIDYTMNVCQSIMVFLEVLMMYKIKVANIGLLSVLFKPV